jgi:hypothetical protein
VLHLKPTLTQEFLGGDESKLMSGGVIDLWGSTPADQCTGNAFFGCQRAAGGGGNVLNPIQSARLRTAQSFSFKYGRVEIRAKLPRGDWIWPAIWMMPRHNAYGGWPASGEIDIMESRGNAPGYPLGGHNAYGSTLHWSTNTSTSKQGKEREVDGSASRDELKPTDSRLSLDLCCCLCFCASRRGANWATNQWPKTHEVYTHGASLADDFHTYGLLWDASGLYTYIDSEANKVLRVSFADGQSMWEKSGLEQAGQNNPWEGRPNNAPFDQKFFLIMNGLENGLFYSHAHTHAHARRERKRKMKAEA